MPTVVPPSSFFRDPGRSGRTLQILAESVVTSGSQYSPDEFVRAISPHLQSSPDADMAVTNLLRFVEATVSRASLFNDLVHHAVLMEVLLKIFGHSQYFADILVRDPGLFRWLTASEVLMTPLRRESLEEEARRIPETFSRPERQLDGLRRLFRREMLRIGVQDLLGNADLISVTRQLSLLADILVDTATRMAYRHIAEKYPERPRARFVVIGLGKLGGEELNYSSDIDVVFVYEHEGESADQRYTYHEFFNKLAERIILILSQSTGEGHLYRVDPRLRPESGAGPLARSVESCLLYYESRGELWERQMLIKARPVGGDVDLGTSFLNSLQPFIYPRTFFQHPAESAARIKARIESSIGSAANIKLMPGGIRDIEFLVQVLQLVNGGRVPGVRGGNTLAAIAALVAHELLSVEELSTLVEAYTFFRTVEHRLQVMLNTQTHDVPSEEHLRASLSIRVGLKSEEELQRTLNKHLKAVRKIFEQVLTVRSETPTSRIETVIEGGMPDEAVSKVLREYGFHDLKLATRLVKTLSLGSGLTERREFETRARDALRIVAPDLFRAIGETPDPDMTLANISHITGAQKLHDQFYQQLNEKGFRRFLVAICALSPRFSRTLAADPLLLETLASNPRLLTEPFAEGLPATDNLIGFKTQQEVHIGVRHILGFSTFDELTHEISGLADFVVKSAVEQLLPDTGTGGAPFAVFALGKFGTRELLFRSDLDLVFVANPKNERQRSRLETAAEAVLRRLTAMSEQGALYDVDARLRPEGRNAPLLVDLQSYERYLADRASLWERQALTRIRCVCGDEQVNRALREIADRFVYDAPLPSGWVSTAIAMRRKMETRRSVHGRPSIDVKVNAGGMVDVEFLAQLCLLKFGRERRDLRGKRTADVLAGLSGSAIAEADVEVLVSAYRRFREVEKVIRITLDERTTILPEGRKREILARATGYGSGAQLRETIEKDMKMVRTLFTSITQHLASGDSQQ